MLVVEVLDRITGSGRRIDDREVELSVVRTEGREQIEDLGDEPDYLEAYRSLGITIDPKLLDD
jgi:hypothetical protein